MRQVVVGDQAVYNNAQQVTRGVANFDHVLSVAAKPFRQRLRCDGDVAPNSVGCDSTHVVCRLSNDLYWVLIGASLSHGLQCERVKVHTAVVVLYLEDVAHVLWDGNAELKIFAPLTERQQDLLQASLVVAVLDQITRKSLVGEDLCVAFTQSRGNAQPEMEDSVLNAVMLSKLSLPQVAVFWLAVVVRQHGREAKATASKGHVHQKKVSNACASLVVSIKLVCRQRKTRGRSRVSLPITLVENANLER